MTDNTTRLKELDGSLERVTKKQKVCYNKTISQIEHLITEFSKCKAQVDPARMETENEPSVSDAISRLNAKVKESNIVTEVSNEHKEYFAVLTKYGKAIDKNFQADIHLATHEGFKFDSKLLNQIIAQHFFREGRFDVGERFVKEGQVELTPNMKEPFVEMYKVLDAMVNRKDLTPAIAWARARRKELLAKGNSLEFKLHRLQFVQFLTASKQDEAIAYARAHFSEFSSTEMKEIQRLMCSLLYIGRLEKSPYASYLSPTFWNDLHHDFTSSCCSLLGMSSESPLYTAVTAGGIALPKQLKVAALAQTKGIKLPSVEVDLGPHFHFHPIFACPVSKEQTTAENPPMRLTCGHVIAKASMIKLARGGTRFKCPYCPVEQVTTRAQQVYF